MKDNISIPECRAGKRRASRLWVLDKGKGNIVEITVKGMSCGHCAATVTKALEALPGVSQVQVDLNTGRVTFVSAGPISQTELAQAVKNAGYELVSA